MPGNEQRQLSWWQVLLIAVGAILAMQAIPVFLALQGLPEPNLIDSGAILGAIFTAGGLIVALVALYTLTTVDKAARDAAKDVLASLPQEIDKRVRQSLDAFDEYMQARSVIDKAGVVAIEDAQEHVKKALAINPKMIGPREWMGTTYWDLARQQFIELHASGYMPPEHNLEPMVGTNIHHAIEYLSDAKFSGEADRTELTSKLAEVYGMLGDYKDMINCVREVAEEDKPNAFADTWTRVFLASGCQSNPQFLRVLASLIEAEIPWLLPELDRNWTELLRLRATSGSPSAYPYLALWVITKDVVRTGRFPPRSPCVINLIPGGNAEGLARWPTTVPDPRLSGIPEFAPDSQQGLLPHTELYNRILDAFFVIAKYG